MADMTREKINDFLTDPTAAADPALRADDGSALPFESIDDFSTEPVGFAEMAGRLLGKVENIFDITAVYNRHSDEYLEACGKLEKGIKYLASCCLTKIALSYKNHTFPELDQLTTDKLYRMASFNYRKLDTALTEKLKKANGLYPELLDMDMRYFNLLLRLRATEAKIHNYYIQYSFGEKDYSPIVSGLAFSEKSWTGGKTGKKDCPPVFHRAPAFPLIRSAAETESPAQENRKRLSASGSTGGTSSAAVHELPASAGTKNTVGTVLPSQEKIGKNSGTSLPQLPAPVGKLPPCVGGPEPGTQPSGKVTLTIGQIRALVNDPLFCRQHPQTVQTFLRLLQQIDST